MTHFSSELNFENFHHKGPNIERIWHKYPKFWMRNVFFTKWPYLVGVVTRGLILLMRRATKRLRVRRFQIHKYVTLKCEFPRDDPRAHKGLWLKCYGTRRCSIWSLTLLCRYLSKRDALLWGTAQIGACVPWQFLRVLWAIGNPFFGLVASVNYSIL